MNFDCCHKLNFSQVRAILTTNGFVYGTDEEIYICAMLNYINIF